MSHFYKRMVACIAITLLQMSQCCKHTVYMHRSYATTVESVLQTQGCVHCSHATTDESLLQTCGVYALQLRHHR